MKKTAKAKGIIKLLKQGYSPREITQRMDASYNYAWTLQKELATEKAAAKAAKETIIEPKPEPEVEAKKEEEVNTVLDEREDQYGSYMQSSDTAIKIKSAMHNAIARNDLHLYPDQLMSLDMIAVKVSRIVNGNPSYRDSWLDIAGYAMLVADRLEGKVRQ
jgi:transposase